MCVAALAATVGRIVDKARGDVQSTVRAMYSLGFAATLAISRCAESAASTAAFRIRECMFRRTYVNNSFQNMIRWYRRNNWDRSVAKDRIMQPRYASCMALEKKSGSAPKHGVQS